MKHLIFHILALSVLSVAFVQMASAASLSVSTSQPLDSAARAAIRAQNLANWTAARAINKTIVQNAKSSGTPESIRAQIQANVSSTKAANKAARTLVQVAVQSSQASTSSSSSSSAISPRRSSRRP